MSRQPVTPPRTTRHRRRLPLLLALLLLATPPLPATEGFYRWRDQGGQLHYGDTPPAEALERETLALPTQRASYRVEKVIDGDTIVVHTLGKVRLLGINAPEVAHRDRPAEPYGDEARQRLTQLLTGRRVLLQFDQQHHDRFGRLLAHLTLEDGTNINRLLLQEGLARALFLPPNLLHLQHYYQAEAQAEQAQRGIWSRPEYRVQPSSRAKACIQRFCRLRGKVLAVNRTGRYTTLQLAGGLQATVHQDDLPAFSAAGIELGRLKGVKVTVRGWVGQHRDSPRLKLRHPLQVAPTPSTQQ